MVEERTADHNLGYFDNYPAPIFEAMTKLNPSPVINHTTPFYGPLLYSLGRIIGAHNVLEIGIAQGWSSGFMSWAVKDNNVRHQMNGKYYGLDIVDKYEVQKQHEAKGLDSEFIIHEQGSVDYLKKQTAWGNEFFNMIFIDGFHSNPYVKQEVELLYPLLEGNGNGYLILHDVYAFVEEAWGEITKDPRYEFEYMRFLPNYGLGILRNMRGYDHNKVFFPEGDQSNLKVFPT